ncbi:MAG: histone deacetylase [Archangiaceae bacterium]|nr:histone deacetylase [Archangiaceae bacterium]
MLRALLASLRRRPLKVWFHPAYRLPLSGTEASTGIDARRANHALHYLLREHAVRPEDVVQPQPVSYADLARVHTSDWLESLAHPATLAHVFAIDEADVVVDELLASVRLACGGTLEAARHALAHRHPALNLLGGFHHASPSRGVGFCAVNDVAVAIAVLRAEGFEGRVGIIDLDAHPPDGTAACVRADPNVTLVSLSGVSWGELPGVTEVVLPKGAGDAEYLAALEVQLAALPPLDLAFVLAGGDVLAGDRLGWLGLSVAGARARDLEVSRKLERVPSVWLPAGGYGPNAWKVLAGTGLTLAFDTDAPIPPDFDPLGAELSDIALALSGDQLGSTPLLSEDDFPELYGRRAEPRLLGFYTREGVEYALERYGMLPLVRRLGFDQLKVVLDGNRMRLLSRDLTLVEVDAEKKQLAGREVLFVNWLSLRNPRAHFSAKRPQLPGQEVPGLGLAQEATTLLALMAERLHLDGVAFRPSWFHMAYTARHGARFLDARRQGRFEALVRDLRALPLLEATRAVADKRVRLDGAPYEWEADAMVRWLSPHVEDDHAEIVAERERCRFTVE